MEEKYLTPEEVSQLLKVNYETVRRWLVSGKLPGAKFGDSWRIRQSDLEAFFKNPPHNGG